jgi:hypothetical protein
MTGVESAASLDASDVQDVVVLAEADIKQSETSKIRNEYLLPDWFLVRNVKTTAELDDLQLPCRIVFSDAENTSETANTSKNGAQDIADGESREAVSEKTGNIDKDESSKAAIAESREDGNEETRGNESDGDDKLHKKVDMLEYQVSYDNFSELRDVTAALLVRDQERQLSPSRPSVLLRSSTNNIPFIEGILLHLAKDLQTTLTSVDLEDFEDLGWEFDRQEQQIIAASGSIKSEFKKEPNRNSLTGMAVHYFGARSKRHASADSWNRNKKAIAAVLDAQNAKSRKRTSENDSHAASIISSVPAVADCPPLLLHVRCSSQIMKLEKGHRFLARLRDSVQERRTSGQGVVLLISCMSAEYDDQPKLRKKIHAGEASTVTITPSNPEGKESSTKNNYTGEINIRRLKRFLRWSIPHLFAPEALEVLQPFSAWAVHGFDGKYESMGLSQWTEEDFQRAITQITGRAFGKSYLNLKDVRIVLSRMGLCETVNETKESKEGTSKDSGEMDVTEETISEKKTEMWSEKLKTIKNDANSFEKALLSCVVNPGNYL